VKSFFRAVLASFALVPAGSAAPFDRTLEGDARTYRFRIFRPDGE
jgi:hypothetical protein